LRPHTEKNKATKTTTATTATTTEEMSAPNGEEMSREELLESLRAAEMQRDMVDDLIRKQQDLIKLMEQKMDKLSEVVPAEQEGDAAEASKPVADQSKT